MKKKAKTQPVKEPSPIALTPRTSVVILIGVTIAMLIPFIGKAFNMDDPLFVWSARHIQSHFADPYGFTVNWYGKVYPMWKVTQNPPLACYYIALWAFVVGWSEPALHLAFLLPAIAATLGIYFLAAKFCSRPFEATLAAILTPVFLLSSTMVMSDVLMLAFWVWAVYLWIQGTESNRHGMLALAMVLVTLSALTKYFGVALIPLLATYSIWSRKRPVWALHMLIPVVVLAAYQIGTHSLYGHGLLSDAGKYATWFNTDNPIGGVTKLITAVIFTGGCIATALFYAPLLWNRKGVLALAIVAGLALIPFSFKTLGTYRTDGPLWPIGLQMALMLAGGIALLALAVEDFISRRDAVSFTLLAWVAGTFIFAGVINWSVNGRSILPMAPAAGILIMRRIEKRKVFSRYVYLPLALAALASIFINVSDYQLAGSGRAAASQIADSYTREGRDIWFEGHWGFQYYMEAQGGKPLAFRSFKPKSGDVLIIPSNNTNVFIQDPGVPPLDVLTFPSSLKLSAMNKAVGAGFYSDQWGPLPFAIGSIPPEYYGAFEVP